MSPGNGLDIRTVTHFYDDFCAAHEASLRVEAGQVHCLLGPSGSGKSTLLRLVAGLERLQQGTISIDGVEVAGPRHDQPPEKRSIGFVFQDYALFPHLDVLRNVRFGMLKSQGVDAAHELLHRVGMEDFAKAMPHTLSGGQQQRVALARALARNPKVMLLDEPFSGLDAQLRQQVRDTTLDVLKAEGVATLMVTHDPSEALLTGDVLSVIQQGRIVQTGPPSEVYTRSASRRIAETFGTVNALRATVVDGRASTPLGDFDVGTVADGAVAGGAVADSKVAEGQEVEVLLRPEFLVLWPDDEAKASEEPAGLARGLVTSIAHDVGSLQIGVLLDDGTELLALDCGFSGLQSDGRRSGWHLDKAPDSAARRSGWHLGDPVKVGVVEGSAMVLPKPTES